MAGDWIKLEVTTPDKPEVFRIADALGIDPDAVLGKLCRVWVWADQQTVNGNAVSVTRSLLDRVAGVPGFSSAMLAAGWLIETGDGLTFPNFGTHNGQTAKARALTKKRVESYRSRGNGSSVTPPLQAALHQRSDSVTREEKRREEEIKTPQPPATGGADVAKPAGVVIAKPKPEPSKQKPEAVPIPAELDTPEFCEAWAEWIADRAARKKPVTDRAARGQLVELAKIGPSNAADCIRASIRNQWQGLFPERFTGGGRGGGNLFDHAAKTENRILAQVAEALAAD